MNFGAIVSEEINEQKNSLEVRTLCHGSWDQEMISIWPSLLYCVVFIPRARSLHNNV